MSFKIKFSEEALRQLNKLDNFTAKKILSKIERASNNIKHFFQRLLGREEFKLRIGDYRIIVRIMFTEKTIYVITLNHRKNVYNKLKRKK